MDLISLFLHFKQLKIIFIFNYMQIINSILIFLFATGCYSQDFFPYEKVIENKDKYNYYDISSSQEKDNFILRGTLITPKTDFEKVVVIVPGSGNDTRNSHFVLAEDFLKNNIAVYRYDERGLGKSEGEFSNVRNGITNKSWDLYYIIKNLKEVEILKNKKMVLIGHSEGGMITIGAIEKGIKVDYLLQWASPIVKRGSIFKHQIKTGLNKQERNLQYPDNNTKYTVIDSINKVVEENPKLDNPSLKKAIIKSLKKSGYKEKNYGWFISLPVYMDILRIDSEPIYKNITIPTLYVIGTDDKHVDPIENVALLKSYQNPKIEIKVFDSLNHYLNHDDLKMSSQDMYKINETAANYLINWVINQ